MNNKQEAVKKLKLAAGIMSSHTDCLSAKEALELWAAFQYLLAYIEDGEEVLASE